MASPPLKKVAKAMLMGLALTYRGRLKAKQRAALFELLDDMAVALTTYGIENDNTRIQGYANILGELSDHIEIPVPKE